MGGSNNTSRACNINEKNAYDRSVLHKAAYYSGSATLLENLITQGADVNARDKGAWTPLHLAAKKWSRRGFTNFIGKWGKHACQGY
mmetsp:Transcript_4612/g.15841  ORF Transcript_4612/g.15841 Transcript_4612/m.15841 type:complete len:86 (-) Transcript_4612:1790-2047(-)